MAFSFNGTHVRTLGFSARLLEVPLLPEFSQDTLSLPELQGVLDLPKRIGSRTLSFELGLKATSRTEQQEKLSALGKLLDQDAAPLILDISPARFITARLKEAPIFSRIGTFSLRAYISFLASDPYFYSKEPFEKTIRGSGHSTLSFHELKTDYKTPLMLSLTSEAKTTMEIQLGNDLMRLTHIFNKGEILELDGKLKTARIIQDTRIRSGLAALSSPTFFEITPEDELQISIEGNPEKLSARFFVYGKWRTL